MKSAATPRVGPEQIGSSIAEVNAARSDQPRKDKFGSEAAAGRVASAGPLMSADDYLARWLVPTSLAAAFKLTVSLPANPP